MSARSGVRTVTTRYVWMPHGTASGWLLVHRALADDTAEQVTHDFWITGEISPDDATDVLKDSAEGWEPLMLGEPVTFLLWPYVLTAVTGKQLRKVRQQLLVAPVRPLAEIRVAVRDTAAGRSVSEPTIILADDPFAPAPTDLDLADDWQTGALDPSTGTAELLAAVTARITLSTVELGPAVAAGRSVPVNRFVARDDHARTALDGVLARRAVRSAIAAVLAEPADDEPRERLVDELRGHGWQFDSSPVLLTGEPKPAFLERLVFFLAADDPATPDPGAGPDRGVAPEHRATYRIATLPGCAVLLHPALVSDLAGYLCPLDPALRSGPEVFRAALGSLPPEWNTPRERGLHLAPPDPDEIITVRGPGPVSIGTPVRVDPHHAQIAGIHHVELFDSQGQPRGTFDLSAIPTQPTASDLPARTQ